MSTTADTSVSEPDSKTTLAEPDFPGRPPASKRRASLIFAAFFYASLVIVVVQLYRADYLKVPHIHNYVALAGAIGLVFTGFLLSAQAWRAVLKGGDIVVPFRVAWASVGLSVFGKYLPGKIWVIVGRAAYVSSHTGAPMQRLSYLSTVTQLLAVWSGLFVGSWAYLGAEESPDRGGILLGLWLALSMMLFVPALHDLVLKVVRRALKRNIHFPLLSAKQTLRAIPTFLGQWLVWGTGMWLLAQAVVPSGVEVSIHAIPTFPLAASLGIAAIFAPGGLGVREALLGVTLVSQGLPLEHAGVIAATSRLWFLVGETGMFTGAAVIHRLSKRANTTFHRSRPSN